MSGSTPPRPNCVFFLGAGFSANYGQPVMSNFKWRADARRAERSAAIEKKGSTEGVSADFILDCYKAFNAFHDERQKYPNPMKLDWGNIEHLLTQAEFLKDLGLPPEGLCEQIKWVIQDVYQKDYWDKRPDRLPSFLQMTRDSGYQPVILTTNYDVICEMTLGREKYHYPGFDIDKGDFAKYTGANGSNLNPDATPIIKIHGSVNWLEHQNHECAAFVDLKSRDETKYKFMTREFDYETCRKDVARFFDNEDKWPEVLPLIVPPLMGKHSEREVIKHQWRAAIDALSNATHVFVIGYSFPVTDVFMSRLWAEAFRSHQSLSKVRVVIVNRECRTCGQQRRSELFQSEFLTNQVRYIQCQTAAFLKYWNSLKDYKGHFINSNFVDGGISDDGCFSPAG